MNPKVSIVTSTYNRADIIGRAIQSVLSQTFTDWEMCIVGDCTPDHTEEVVRGFNDERMRFYNLREKSPPGAHGALAKNYAIQQMARGEFIAYLDDDDAYHPNYLRDMLAFIYSIPGCESAYCRGRFVDKETGERVWGNPFQGWLMRYSKEKLHRYNYINTNWVMHRRSLLERVGYWNPNTFFDDYDLWLRISKVTDFHYLNKVLVDNYIENEEPFSRRAWVKGWQMLKQGGKRMPLPYDGDYEDGVRRRGINEK